LEEEEFKKAQNCDKADINVWELINLANHHPRVKILQPGAGVGGHCIAVDPWFIVSDFPTEAKLIKAGREVNDYKTEWVVEKIKNTALQFELNNKHKPVIACMGLAFKPDIDDLRESPALEIAKCINDEVCTVVCVEPNVNELKGLTLVSLNQAIEQADIICYLVKHSAFKGLKNTTNKIELDFCDV
ncbi:MAG TPA: UDP binding domain-containing protein, partial [Chitinophagaceae bacterium]|nr:UDP binding domain-containing protein [Chitinophagaceae bacterium]